MGVRVCMVLFMGRVVGDDMEQGAGDEGLHVSKADVFHQAMQALLDDETEDGGERDERERERGPTLAARGSNQPPDDEGDGEAMEEHGACQSCADLVVGLCGERDAVHHGVEEEAGEGDAERQLVDEVLGVFAVATDLLGEDRKEQPDEHGEQRGGAGDGEGRREDMEQDQAADARQHEPVECPEGARFSPDQLVEQRTAQEHEE